ncbi:hypothetical protein V7S43_004897 [Phytophthora oleae]|uniref:t-SNARE coiled-coil homology domain-containing protein n=1 Tax=Phytophthora oleae TaxID=2107226 RepID=A0ABD3FT98_9STRA
MVTQETTREMSVHRGQAGYETSQQLNELARTSAAAHHIVVKEIDQVRQQQGEIAAKTSDLQQQQDIRKHIDEQRQYIEEQFRLLKAEEEAIGRQERQIEDLVEAIRPHIKARRGLFAERR